MTQLPIRAAGRGHMLLVAAVVTLALAAGLLAGRGIAAADPGSEDLSTALGLIRDGYYREAADSLTALLDGAATPDAEALAALAQSHEGLGDWAAAGDDWLHALAATHDAATRATYVFRRANALQQAGQPLLAARLYRLFLALRPGSAARGETLGRIGDCYVAAGLSSLAVGYYQRELADLAPSSGRVDVLLRLTDALLLAGDPGAALEAFAAEEAGVPTGDVARYQYRWAQAQRAAGDVSGGFDRMRALVASYPKSGAAYAALIDLVDAGQEVDDYQRGLVDYYAGAYEPAVAAFQRYVEANPDGHLPAAHYFAGLSLRGLKMYPEAVAELDRLIDGHPDDANVADAMVAKAEALAKADDAGSAATTYLTLADTRGDSKQAPGALYSAGLLLEELGRSDEAEQAYVRLYTGYAGDAQAAPAALRAGIVAYRASRWTDAEAYFGQAAAICGSCDDASRYRFWQVRSLLAQQRRDDANALLTSVVGGGPDDYYSYRAWVLLLGNDPMGQLSGSLLIPDAAAQAEAEAWLQQTADASWQSGTLAPALLADGRFAQAQEWLALGLDSRATDLALSVGSDLRQDDLAEYTLALWLRDQGLYRASIQVAANIIYTHNDATDTVPTFIWSLVYPVYYGDLVLAEAEADGLDPLLYFALLRQESLFDARIGSHAGAQGLGQIMPATGEWIASMLGDADYVESDLLRPCVSVQYGAWYLAHWMAYLGGDPLAGLAAYNAGPGYAAEWQAAAAGDPDLFYETVAFGETRRYLNTILPNYYQYRRIYGGS